MLKPGEIYVFATRYNIEEDWYTILSHPRGKSLLYSSKRSLDSSKLRSLSIDKNDRVIQLKEAYPNEILLERDIEKNNTRNSYKDK